MRPTTIALLALLAPTVAFTQGTLTVVVDVTRPPTPGAMLRVAVCPDLHAFVEEAGCVVASAPAQAPTTRITIPDVKPGVYAIKCYVDDNANEKLDTGPFGIPDEPYGFSNNAMRMMGPPSFEMCTFTVTEGANIQRITMR